MKTRQLAADLGIRRGHYTLQQQVKANGGLLQREATVFENHRHVIQA